MAGGAPEFVTYSITQHQKKLGWGWMVLLRVFAKVYILSTLNTDLIFWQAIYLGQNNWS